MADPAPTKRLKVNTADSDSTCAEQNDAVTPYLPSQTIGGVLDFMVYSDVRPMLMAGKPMAVDASRCVKTLSVMETSELKVRPALRFSNVEELNICCLFDYEEDRLSAEAAERIVPFLDAFPKLKALYIGGGYVDMERVVGSELHKAEYFDFYCDDQPDHRDIFRGLVDKLAAAIKANKLPYLTEVRGLNSLGADDCIDDVDDSSEPCDRCVDLCKTLPMRNVAKLTCFGTGTFRKVCLSDIERFRIISKRNGGRDFMKRSSAECLPGRVNRYIAYVILERPGKTPSEKKLLGKLNDQVPHQKAAPSHADGKGRIRHLLKELYEILDELIALGFDPSLAPRRCLYQSFLPDHLKTDAWSKSTLEFLLSRGFDIDMDDFHVFDESEDEEFQQVLDERYDCRWCSRIS